MVWYGLLWYGFVLHEKDLCIRMVSKQSFKVWYGILWYGVNGIVIHLCEL